MRCCARRAGVDRVALLGIRLGAIARGAGGTERRRRRRPRWRIAPVVAGKALPARAARAADAARPGPRRRSHGVARRERPGGARASRSPPRPRPRCRSILTRLERAPARGADDRPRRSAGGDPWAARLRAPGADRRARAAARLRRDGARSPQARRARRDGRGHHRVAARRAAAVAALPPRAGASGDAGEPRIQARPTAAVIERAAYVDDRAPALRHAARAGDRAGERPRHPAAQRRRGATRRAQPPLRAARPALGRARPLVLRLDLSGIGDSPPRPGEPENVVYSDRALADVAAAVACLRRQPASSRCGRRAVLGRLPRLQGGRRRRPGRRRRGHQPADVLLEGGHACSTTRPTGSSPRRRATAARCATSTSGRSSCAATSACARRPARMSRRAAARLLERARDVLAPGRRAVARQSRRRARGCWRRARSRCASCSPTAIPGSRCCAGRAARRSRRSRARRAVDRGHRRARPHLHRRCGRTARSPRCSRRCSNDRRRGAEREMATPPTPSTPPGPGDHVPALDGVRGLAVLLVLAHNLNVLGDGGPAPVRALGLAMRPGLGGRAAVLRAVRLPDHRHPARHRARADNYYRSFLGRRMLRIFPLYYAVLLVAFVAVPLVTGSAIAGAQHQVWLWTYSVNWVDPLGSTSRCSRTSGRWPSRSSSTCAGRCWCTGCRRGRCCRCVSPGGGRAAQPHRPARRRDLARRGLRVHDLPGRRPGRRRRRRRCWSAGPPPSPASIADRRAIGWATIAATLVMLVVTRRRAARRRAHPDPGLHRARRRVHRAGPRRRAGVADRAARPGPDLRAGAAAGGRRLQLRRSTSSTCRCTSWSARRCASRSAAAPVVASRLPGGDDAAVAASPR